MNIRRDQVLIKLTCFRVIVPSGVVGASQMGTVAGTHEGVAQLKEAQPLLELAKVRTSQGYKINRGVNN